VPCSKSHHENPCEPADPAATPAGDSAEPSEAPASADWPRADGTATLTPAQVSSLRTNEPVRAAVRDPALQEVLRRIDDAADPVAALNREFADPDFVAFADKLLASVVGAREIAREDLPHQMDLHSAKEHLLQLVNDQATGMTASQSASSRPTR
jgi:hypothetical protein